MEAVVGLFEKVFGTIGLTYPLYRLLGVAALGTAIEFFVRPSYAFDDHGNVRPWAIPFQNPPANAVYTPVGFYPVLAGIATALFL